MKICVIGGSGFVGTHLIKLIHEKHEVAIIDKNDSKTFPELVIKGDIRNKEFLLENLKNFDLVINLAAEHKDNVHPISLYYEVNVDAAQNILDAMDANGIKRIVFTSSVAIYGLNRVNPDENTNPNPFNDYGKSKLQAEEVYNKWYNASPEGKTLLMVRPTVIYGENNRGNVYNLFKQIEDKKFIMIGKGQNRKSMAYVGNIVHFIEYLIPQEGYNVFNYADKPDLTTKELLELIQTHTSVEIPKLSIPYWLGMLGGFGFDVLSKIFRKEFPISSIRIKKFCATTQFDASKAMGMGYKAPYSQSEAIKRTFSFEFGED